MASDSSSAGRELFDRLLDEQRRWLSEHGEALAGSGRFDGGGWSVSWHSVFGPPEQDKSPENQDYVLAWRPRPADAGRFPEWILALADGVTSSFRADWAAEIACWSAVRTLAEGGTEPRASAQRASDAACAALGRIADGWAVDPSASCPPGQFPATWKYILRKGLLLQTTLTLAWLDRGHFFAALIGDGGALWRAYDPITADRILAECDPQTQQVHALGPGVGAAELDGWVEEQRKAPYLCALFTDGVGRGVGAAPFALLDEAARLAVAGEENPARAYLEEVLRRRPADFADNLTLAVLHEGPMIAP